MHCYPPSVIARANTERQGVQDIQQVWTSRLSFAAPDCQSDRKTPLAFFGTRQNLVLPTEKFAAFLPDIYDQIIKDNPRKCKPKDCGLSHDFPNLVSQLSLGSCPGTDVRHDRPMVRVTLCFAPFSRMPSEFNDSACARCAGLLRNWRISRPLAVKLRQFKGDFDQAWGAGGSFQCCADGTSMPSRLSARLVVWSTSSAMLAGRK